MGRELVVPRGQLPQLQNARRAAQYVRMSTDFQRYSIENQAAAIAAYASLHQLTIVRTYRDDGISGLKLKNRTGLIELLDDVKSGRPGFDHVLIYDVSRWGRFQDVDESAYYEFFCKQNGVKVVYCGEPFENDGSLLSSIFKNIKRVMAAEFSRELSAKVHAGQCRIARLGYRVGGPIVFGLRRELVGESQRSKGFLIKGESKALQTDRVRLRLGSQQEADVIRSIFHQFVVERKSYAKIGRELNQANVPGRDGAAWSDHIVRGVLRNENYIGNILHNRTSRRLGQKLAHNPVSLWIRRQGVIDPIVDQSLFERAQKIMDERYLSLTEDEMLMRLRILLHRKGKLNYRIINEASSIPSTACYFKRFGSLRKAYARIGYGPRRDFDWIDTKEHWASVLATHVARTAEAFSSARGAKAIRVDDNNSTVIVGQKLKIVFVIARRCTRLKPSHMAHWRVYRKKRLVGLLAVLRLDSNNREIKDYALLPASKIKRHYLRLTDVSPAEGVTRVTKFSELIKAVKALVPS